MMQHPIRICAVVNGKTADVEILLVVALDFLVAHHHLGIHLWFVLTRLPLIVESYTKVELLLLLYLWHNKHEAVEAAIAVDVVKL